MSNYVSLHNQTTYSLLDSLCSVKDLFLKAKELNQSAIAITDHGSLAATWEAFKIYKETGIKFIVGCEFYFVDDAKNIDSKFRHVILIAKNAVGYRNLLTLNKKSFDQGKTAGNKVYPVLDWKLLNNHYEGLVCLTACGNGIVSQLLSSGKVDEAEKTLLKLKDLFQENLGIEVLANNMKRPASMYSSEIDQKFLNKQLINLASKHNIKVVPTSNTHYIDKSDYKTHDVLLAIGSKQSVYSNFRLKYNVNDFYLKSEEDIYTFFSRNYSKEFVNEMIENTKYFSDLCEVPEWIDPKYSNPSGKELPTFPVKDEPDYQDFLNWNLNKNLTNLSEDKQYLRYVIEKSFNNKIILDKIPEDMIQVYKDRIENELSVLEELDISSYMLITADFLNYARKNNIQVGPGRGCLTGDTLVLTDNSFKKLKDINVGDSIYTHTGNIEKCFNKFEYLVNETGLEINSYFSFTPIKLTKDHKVLASKSIKTKQYIKYELMNSKSLNKIKKYENCFDPKWISVDKLSVNDYIYMTFPKRTNFIDFFDCEIDNIKYIDLSKYIENEYIINPTTIVQKIPLNNNLSIRKITTESGLSRSFLQKVLSGKASRKSSFINLNDYLSKINLSIDDFLLKNNFKEKSHNRFIKSNSDLYYIIGRWVGDGWTHKRKNGSYITGIAFHKNDVIGQNIFINFLNENNFQWYKNESKTKKLTQITVIGYVLYNFFNTIVCDYKQTSNTKHLPSFYKLLNNSNLKSLLTGLFDSDGHFEKKMNRMNFDTTSKRLALEVKESLLYLKIPSSINTRNEYYANNYLYSTSYKVRFRGFDKEKIIANYIDDNGYYCKIIDIKEVNIDKVYDISINNDMSYLTSSGAVHNSAGGSYIAYLLNIHIADSVKYGLVFERFHNKLKKSMSDVDNDILSDGREKVIQYVRNKYGEDNVASISNFNRITSKVYIRDIARACELGGTKESAVKIGNDVAGLVPADVKSIDIAFKEIPLFAEYCKKYPEFINNKQINNQIRNTSQHAAGIVINKRPLTGLIPLRKDKDNNVVLEYEKETAESNGLVKIDILGLKTLDVLDLTFKLIKENGKEVPQINFEENDEKTYKLISSGKCEFIFQFGGSAGTMDLCKKIKPQNIEDLAVITTLARPGCAAIREEFIKTRFGKKPVTYLHPKLENALKNTLGYALYDESLLILSKDTAGWDLAEADGLRKLTKLKGSKPKLAMELKENFIKGCIANGISESDSLEIWIKVVEPYGLYSFNKSHAILYSIISYQTAYLKAHFPIEYLLANLMFEVKSNTPTAKVNISKIKKELREHKVKILPPNINTSSLEYKLVDNKTLLTGLDALKNVGDDAILDILDKRPFNSFQDFMSRVSSRLVRSSTIQALAAAGALDGFGMSRKDMFLYNSDYRKKLTTWKKKHNSDNETFNYPFEKSEDWTKEEYYALEVNYLNEGFICKPHEAYSGFFDDNHVVFNTIKKANNKTNLMPIKALVIDVFEFKIKKEDSKLFGQVMAKVLLQDKNNDKYSCTVFPDRWETVINKMKRSKIKAFEPGLALSFSGSSNLYEDEVGVILNDIYDIKDKPQMPEDRKQKKVSLRNKDKATAISDILETNVEDPSFEEQIKEYLYDENLIDVEFDDE